MAPNVRGYDTVDGSFRDSGRPNSRSTFAGETIVSMPDRREIPAQMLMEYTTRRNAGGTLSERRIVESDGRHTDRHNGRTTSGRRPYDG